MKTISTDSNVWDAYSDQYYEHMEMQINNDLIINIDNEFYKGELKTLEDVKAYKKIVFDKKNEQ